VCLRIFICYERNNVITTNTIKMPFKILSTKDNINLVLLFLYLISGMRSNPSNSVTSYKDYVLAFDSIVFRAELKCKN
jgi:hypothetical protein